jgi:hypothetical protein
VIGASRSQETAKGRRRRALLVLLLALFAFCLGGLSIGLIRGEPRPAAEQTQSVASSSAPAGPSSSAPAPAASSSEVVQGVEVQPTGLGSGGQVVPVNGLDFTISGQASGLAPGVSTPIRLTLTNPNGMPIYVTSLTVRIAADSTPAGCGTATNIRLTQASVSDANPIVVAARSSVTLAAAPRAPQITLLNLPGVNQDVCKNKSFALTYSGTAHS